MLSSIEICAGAGGQALGLEHAGFDHRALVEIESDFCATLRLNRPQWNVINNGVEHFSGLLYKGTDLLAGGVPCPPFSKAGKQLGADDERNLFPEAIRLVDEIRPRAVMFENVRGLMDAVFEDYRRYIAGEIGKMGYETDWRLLSASDFGVPQLRPRVVFVAVRKHGRGPTAQFTWPELGRSKARTVGETLRDLMAADNWRGADAWAAHADEIGPTLVGGSKKHGGPDLGPTRARQAWAALGVDGRGLADAPPAQDFVGMPRLTTRMAARIQGFPDAWLFAGKKTSTYRQIGNAFPPPVARAVGLQIAQCLQAKRVFAVAA
jgi:DNA (cytosine-5)-methyltransferase 1